MFGAYKDINTVKSMLDKMNGYSYSFIEDRDKLHIIALDKDIAHFLLHSCQIISGLINQMEAKDGIINKINKG